ncbi:MAG: hypothetical protein WD044_11275 [Dongiaceae bacterium]
MRNPFRIGGSRTEACHLDFDGIEAEGWKSLVADSGAVAMKNE